MFSDLRFALRLFLRHPAFAAASILVLAIGIGSTTAVHSILDAVLLKPLPFDRPERVVALRVRKAGRGEFGVSGGVVAAVRQLPAIERTAAIIHTEQNLVGGTELAVVRGALVTREFFDVFGVAPLAGRTFNDGDAPDALPLVIGERLWRQRFAADPSIVGRTVRLDDSTLTILGVMPRAFSQPEDAAYWRLMQPGASQLAVLAAGPYDAVARVNHFGLEAARSQAAVLSGTLPKGETGALSIALIPLLGTMTAEYEMVLHLVMGAVVLVLLMACGNVAVLLIARTSGRSRELAVRGAIGATRTRLARQLFTESILLAAGGGMAGCAVAWLLVRAVPVLGAVEMPRVGEAAVDARALAFTLSATAASVLLFGLAPAFVSMPRTESLQGRGTPPRRARLASKGLIALDIALTLALLIGGILTMSGLYRMLTVDVGFDRDRLAIATIRPSTTRYAGADRIRFYEQVVDRVRATSGIEAAGGMSFVPLAAYLPPTAAIQTEDHGSRPAASATARFRTIAPGTFAAIRAPILKGRDFTSDDRDGRPLAAIVNEALAARVWPGRDPLGQSVRVSPRGEPPQTFQIVGIVRDVRGSMRAAPTPELYVSASQRPLRSMTLIVRSALDLRTLEMSIRAAVASVDAEQPMTDLTTMSALTWEATAYNRFRAVLLTIFSMFAVLLAATGIIGVVSHAVVDRTRELGVRMAVGAAPRQLVAVVMFDLVWPVGLGVVAGLTASYNVAHPLRRFLGTQEFEPTIYASAAVGLVLLAGLAAWLPARRAARIDPIRALAAD